MSMPIRVAALVLLLACSACGKPERPKKDQPPEPQATVLRDTIQRPIDKAKAVEPQVLDAAKRQDAALQPVHGAPVRALAYCFCGF